MTQLATDEGAAVGGDPVEEATDATTDETAAEQTEQDDLESLYPDDQGEDEPDSNDEGEDEEDSTDEGEGEPDDEPAIDPPHSWKAEARAHWDALPRETQEYLRQRDQEQTQFVNAKAREASQAREEVQQQAIAELAQFKEQQATQYRQLAQQFFPQEPDERLLYSNNQQDHLTYRQQEAAYKRGLAQQRQLQQAAEQEAAEAQRIRDDQDKQQRQAEIQHLQEKVPELFDADAGPKLQQELTGIAKALGYPDDLLPEANAVDILALRQASEWKSKAEKWDTYQKSKMAGVRAAKKKLPTPNKPGSHSREAGTSDPVKLLYPND